MHDARCDADGDRAQTAVAYGEHAAARPHLLGYHQALHLTGHASQIRMIRNLYKKTRGRRRQFFPENRSYPGQS